MSSENALPHDTTLPKDENNLDKYKANYQRAKEQLNIKIFSIINSQLTNWLEGVHVEHKIPKILAGNVPEVVKILNNTDNLQLVHVTCHAQQTKEDRVFLSKYSKIRSTHLPNNLGMYTKEELQVATCKIILDVIEIKLLESYNSKIVRKLINVSKVILKKKGEI
jgi:hypothetical protein